MNGLLADANFEGQTERLMQVLRSPEWLDLWLSYGLTVQTLGDLGLDNSTDDRTVWKRCQAEGLILLTGNRNDEGDDSLEAVIRDGPPDALPVFTVANGRRIMEDTAFARDVALAMLDAVDDLTYRPETILGSGRIYLPRNPLRS